jgi:hypothetical protein
METKYREQGMSNVLVWYELSDNCAFRMIAGFHEGSVLILSLLLGAGESLCSLVVRVPGCRSRGPGLIIGATRFSDK